MLTSFATFGFNSNAYDMPILALAIAGANAEQLWGATQQLIIYNVWPWQLLKACKVKQPDCDHVDLIEVAPLSATLKTYGGRLHSKRMQDLPFVAGTMLTWQQAAIVRCYNGNDNDTTIDLRNGLLEQLKLRESLSLQYGLDLRSKSDAQIAEAIIATEVGRANGAKVKKPHVEAGTTFYYQPAAFLRYSTPLLQHVFYTVCTTPFRIEENLTVGLPKAIADLTIAINRSKYQMGLGGLHSQEQKAVYFSTPTHTIKDRDVISYYPKLITNSGMYPPQMGPAFQHVYQTIVARRVQAKAAGNTVEADSLKITANGTFGKLGSPHSTLTAHDLMIQVTITGQLSLLMLIERMELAGIPVVSANTDGIVMDCPNVLHDTYLAIIKQWEADTNLQTEETIYHALYSRDVNNYMAVKLDGKVKAKGAYLNAWNDPKLAIFRFHKNPVTMVCNEALEAYLTKGTPLAQTITSCTDITKFVVVRKVKGGAVKVQGDDVLYLGKSIRWYYAQGETGELVYADSGNKVPRSEGAKPCMQLPDVLPDDIDFDWYIKEADTMLCALGLQTTLQGDAI
jgi:hypothetical protein